MSIEVTCPNGHHLRVKEECAGKSGQCPHCQARIVVPQRGPISEDDLLAVLGTPRKVPRSLQEDVAPSRPKVEPPHAEPHKSHSHQAAPGTSAKGSPAQGSSSQGASIDRRRVCPKCCEIVAFANDVCPHCRTSLSGWSFPLPEESKSEGNRRSSCHYLGLRKQGDVMVIRFGEHRILDDASVKKFGEELFHVADRDDCHNVLLNFTGVTGLCSAMLGIMLMLRKKIAQKPGNSSCVSSASRSWKRSTPRSSASSSRSMAPSSRRSRRSLTRRVRGARTSGKVRSASKSRRGQRLLIGNVRRNEPSFG